MDGGKTRKAESMKQRPYAAIDDILTSCIVVDVDCDAAEGGDFGGELLEAGVVLPNAPSVNSLLVDMKKVSRRKEWAEVPFSLVGVRHGYARGPRIESWRGVKGSVCFVGSRSLAFVIGLQRESERVWRLPLAAGTGQTGVSTYSARRSIN